MRSTTTILQLFLKDLRQNPGSAIASVLAIALGVALFIAIQLAGSAARSSFVSAVEAVSGKTTHEVSQTGGLPPARFTDFMDHPSVQAAQPIVEDYVSIHQVYRDHQKLDQKIGPLRILGVDPLLSNPFLTVNANEPLVSPSDFNSFLTEAGSTLVSRSWAEENDLKLNDLIQVAVRGELKSLKILGIYDFEVLGEAVRETAVVDIATAQEVLGRTETIDRFDLIIKKGEEEKVSQILKPGERLERPSQRGERTAKMVDAFRLNLAALGSLALLVGSLLVFNAGQFRVVRRSQLMGQLRCLGVEGFQLRLAILVEISLFGLIGSGLGIVIGNLLAQGLTGSISQTITDLYTFIQVEITPISGTLVVITIAGATAITALAGWIPASDASKTSPRLTGIRSREEHDYKIHLPRLVALSILSFGMGILSVNLEVGGWWVGILASIFFLVSAACALPPILATVLPALKRLSEQMGFHLLPIALGALYRSLSRTSGAAAALGVSLGMTIGVIIMVTSFQKEVMRWVQSNLQADVYIADAYEKVSRNNAKIPESFLADLKNYEEIENVDTLRGLEIPFKDGSIFFTGIDLHSGSHVHKLEFLEGNPDRALKMLQAGEVIISEPLATKHDLSVGDPFPLSSRQGERQLTVAGVFRDYSYDRGYASTSKERFVQEFGDTGVRNMGLYLKPGIDAEAFSEKLRKDAAKSYFLKIRSNSQLRADVLEIFNRTFQLTYLLQTIATILALTGIGVTLYCLFIERAKEIATLRSIGASLRQITRLLLAESITLALVPVVLAIPLGAILAWILISVVNLRAFGWSLPFHWPLSEIALTCSLALGAGLVASFIPFKAVKNQSLAQILREQ